MSRQFANVSISPWANPFNGAVNTGHNYYTSTVPKQPLYLRAVTLPVPKFVYPGIKQIVGDDDNESGDVPIDSAPPPEAPAPPASEAPGPEQSEPSEPPPPPPPPLETSSTETSAPLEDESLPPPPVDVGVAVPAVEAAPESSLEAEEGTSPDGEGASANSDIVVIDVKDEPPGSGDVATEGAAPPSPSPPPPPPTEDSKSALPPPLPADATPEPSVAGSEKSGESEQAAQESPKSPILKFVHFASDTKDPDAGKGKQKRKIHKPNAFVRMRNPPPPSPTSPKEDKKKVVDKTVKKKERRPSILSLSSIERPKLSKTDDRKQKKSDEKDRKSNSKKSKSKSVLRSDEDRAVIAEAETQPDVDDSVITEDSGDTAIESVEITSDEAPPPPPPSDEPSSEVPEDSTEEASPLPPSDPTPPSDGISLGAHDTANEEVAPPTSHPPPPPEDCTIESEAAPLSEVSNHDKDITSDSPSTEETTSLSSAPDEAAGENLEAGASDTSVEETSAQPVPPVEAPLASQVEVSEKEGTDEAVENDVTTPEPLSSGDPVNDPGEIIVTEPAGESKVDEIEDFVEQLYPPPGGAGAEQDDAAMEEAPTESEVIASDTVVLDEAVTQPKDVDEDEAAAGITATDHAPTEELSSPPNVPTVESAAASDKLPADSIGTPNGEQPSPDQASSVPEPELELSAQPDAVVETETHGDATAEEEQPTDVEESASSITPEADQEHTDKFEVAPVGPTEVGSESEHPKAVKATDDAEPETEVEVANKDEQAEEADISAIDNANSEGLESGEPAAEDSATEESSSEEPASEKVAAVEPTVEAPASEEPVTEEPVAIESVSEAPAVEEPAAEEPAEAEPTAEEPAAKEPATEAPAVEEPAAEESAEAEPAAEQPATEAPDVEAPAEAEPAQAEPAAEESAAEAPTTEAPAAEEPATEAPAAEGPATEEPAAEEPAAEDSAVEEPAAEAPAAEAPAAEAPATEAPAAEEPAAEEPAAEALAAEAPAKEAPAEEEPASDEQAAEESLLGQSVPEPSAAEPSREEAATEEAATEEAVPEEPVPEKPIADFGVQGEFTEHNDAGPTSSQDSTTEAQTPSSDAVADTAPNTDNQPANQQDLVADSAPQDEAKLADEPMDVTSLVQEDAPPIKEVTEAQDPSANGQASSEVPFTIIPIDTTEETFKAKDTTPQVEFRIGDPGAGEDERESKTSSKTTRKKEKRKAKRAQEAKPAVASPIIEAHTPTESSPTADPGIAMHEEVPEDQPLVEGSQTTQETANESAPDDTATATPDVSQEANSMSIKDDIPCPDANIHGGKASADDTQDTDSGVAATESTTDVQANSSSEVSDTTIAPAVSEVANPGTQGEGESAPHDVFQDQSTSGTKSEPIPAIDAQCVAGDSEQAEPESQNMIKAGCSNEEQQDCDNTTPTSIEMESTPLEGPQSAAVQDIVAKQDDMEHDETSRLAGDNHDREDQTEEVEETHITTRDAEPNQGQQVEVHVEDVSVVTPTENDGNDNATSNDSVIVKDDDDAPPDTNLDQSNALAIEDEADDQVATAELQEEEQAVVENVDDTAVTVVPETAGILEQETPDEAPVLGHQNTEGQCTEIQPDVTSENLSDPGLTGAVENPSCEDPVKDSTLAEPEANIQLENQEPEAENNHGKVIETEEPMPAMSEAGMADDQSLNEIDAKNEHSLVEQGADSSENAPHAEENEDDGENTQSDMEDESASEVSSLPSAITTTEPMDEPEPSPQEQDVAQLEAVEAESPGIAVPESPAPLEDPTNVSEEVETGSSITTTHDDAESSATSVEDAQAECSGDAGESHGEENLPDIGVSEASVPDLEALQNDGLGAAVTEEAPTTEDGSSIDAPSGDHDSELATDSKGEEDATASDDQGEAAGEAGENLSLDGELADEDESPATSVLEEADEEEAASAHIPEAEHAPSDEILENGPQPEVSIAVDDSENVEDVVAQGEETSPGPALEDEDTNQDAVEDETAGTGNDEATEAEPTATEAETEAAPSEAIAIVIEEEVPCPPDCNAEALDDATDIRIEEDAEPKFDGINDVPPSLPPTIEEEAVQEPEASLEEPNQEVADGANVSELAESQPTETPASLEEPLTEETAPEASTDEPGAIVFEETEDVQPTMKTAETAEEAETAIPMDDGPVEQNPETTPVDESLSTIGQETMAEPVEAEPVSHTDDEADTAPLSESGPESLPIEDVVIDGVHAEDAAPGVEASVLVTPASELPAPEPPAPELPASEAPIEQRQVELTPEPDPVQQDDSPIEIAPPTNIASTVVSEPPVAEEEEVTAEAAIANTDAIAEPSIAEEEAIEVATVEAVADASPVEAVEDSLPNTAPQAEAIETVAESQPEVVEEDPQPEVTVAEVSVPIINLTQGPVVDQPSYDSAPKERDFAIVDGPAAEQSPREKQRRRHSHTHRDSKHHSSRRRESEASTKERPTLGGQAGVLTTTKLAGAARSTRRDSITEREIGRGKERRREGEKDRSNSSKERTYPEHRPHRLRENRGEEKQSRRRELEETEEEMDKRKRRERRALRERLDAENAMRLRDEEEARRQERRERRQAAKQVEDERLKAEVDRRKQKEGERLAKEDEERRLRHEKRRQQHEAEKEVRRQEIERAEQAAREEEEIKRVRRQKRAEREREKVSGSRAKKGHVEDFREVPREAPRDAARRAYEEDDEIVPQQPSTPPPPPDVSESPPRSVPRRRMSTREPPPTTKRNSILGGFSLFSRSKTEAVTPTSKSTKPVARVRSDPIEVPETPVRALRKEMEQPNNSHQSSNDSRDHVERPHRSRRQSNGQRHRFNNAAEEDEYYRQKEKRRAARLREHEMSGGRDGGFSLAPVMNDLPPPPPEPFEYEPMPVFEPEPEARAPSLMMTDAVAEVGVASTSSAERRERRRTRRASGVEERPRTRRITVTEDQRPVSRRIESDRPRTRGHDEERPRTRGHDEERPRPRRGETERKSGGTHRSSRKKEESGGLKSLFGGLKKTFA